MEQLLEQTFGGSIKPLVKKYFELEIGMLEAGGLDILGQCDLVKNQNVGNRFFDQNEDWYRREALTMLEAAASKDIVIEVNTGGLSRKATTEVYRNNFV